jgi:hypothetical protein
MAGPPAGHVAAGRPRARGTAAGPCAVASSQLSANSAAVQQRSCALTHMASAHSTRFAAEEDVRSDLQDLVDGRPGSMHTLRRATPASRPLPRSDRTNHPVPRAPARSSPSPAAAASPPHGHRPTPPSSTSLRPATSPPAGPAAPACATPASPTSSWATPPTPPNPSNPPSPAPSSSAAANPPPKSSSTSSDPLGSRL